ncbi:MAG: PQQ-binding-like beta-propeller repeat protein [Planctomycetaceae bacterium]
MPESNKRGLPWLMILWSILLVCLTVLPRIYIAEVEEATDLGLDFIGFITLLTGALFFLSWTLWCLFFSGWRWWRRLFGAALTQAIPVGLIALLFLGYVVPVGGDLNAFQWRRKPANLTTSVDAASGVDLAVETANDFPGYLGPDQTGAINIAEIDADRFSEARTLWKKKVGEAWSGFATRNGFAVTMEQRNEFECVTCYDIQSGDLKWMYKHKARHHEFMGKTGPRATPMIYKGRVYAVGALGNFVCLNGQDGSVVWQKDIKEILGVEVEEKTDPDGLVYQWESNSTLAWGRAGSPIIVDDTVVVPGGATGQKTEDGWAQDDGAATLLAFDLNTGELKWKGGDQMIGYATPTLVTLDGRKQIIITAEAMILGVDAKTGEQLWSHPRDGQSNGMANTSQLSVINKNQILSAKGYPDGGGELLTITQKDGKFVPVSEWKNKRVLKTKLTSPVIHDGHAYALSNGFMECTRVEDGKRLWKQRGRFGHGQLLLVGDKLLLQTEETGKLMLIQATPDSYEQLGEIDTGIDGICWNTLCLSGNKLLLRSDREAACIELSVAAKQTKDDATNRGQQPGVLNQ